jgi:RHS repeat-associated protein
VALYTRIGSAEELRYVLADNLGSAETFVEDGVGTVVNASFTAYGLRRDAQTWAGEPSNRAALDNITRQGFTFQTVLGAMGLNHMNGRVQDAITAKFLSPDPYVTDPDYTQNYNRYSYVYNNPATYVDPSGFGCVDVQRSTSIGVTVPPRPGSAPDDRGTIAALTTHQWTQTICWDHTGSGEGRREGGDEGDRGGGGGGGGGGKTGETPPPPCELGPSSASGAIGASVYSGVGGEGAVGLHDGRTFATGRAGWGLGSSFTYNPEGGLPATPPAEAPGGYQLNVSAKAGIAGGIPFTSFGFSWQFELGVAYDSNGGFIVLKDFKKPKYGFPSEKGFRRAASIGGQYSVYGRKATVYKNSGTCRAQR